MWNSVTRASLVSGCLRRALFSLRGSTFIYTEINVYEALPLADTHCTEPNYNAHEATAVCSEINMIRLELLFAVFIPPLRQLQPDILNPSQSGEETARSIPQPTSPSSFLTQRQKSAEGSLVLCKVLHKI